jgi:bifunctional DNA-binding transcriptional regulator/antitoxin component of YhaV-PrlF toxin-antitoxin module
MLKLLWANFMMKVISIDDRGTLTLPEELRDRLGITTAGQVVVEETLEGLLLRPGVIVPIEVYSAERLAEFYLNNDSALDGFKPKQSR